MEFINSWKSLTKKNGKISIKVRLGFVTFFDIFIDLPKKRWGFMLFNLGIKNSNIKR